MAVMLIAACIVPFYSFALSSEDSGWGLYDVSVNNGYNLKILNSSGEVPDTHSAILNGNTIPVYEGVESMDLSFQGAENTQYMVFLAKGEETVLTQNNIKYMDQQALSVGATSLEVVFNIYPSTFSEAGSYKVYVSSTESAYAEVASFEVAEDWRSVLFSLTDVNRDNKVNQEDLRIISDTANYNKSVGDAANKATDVNGDGEVNFLDLAEVRRSSDFDATEITPAIDTATEYSITKTANPSINIEDGSILLRENSGDLQYKLGDFDWISYTDSITINGTGTQTENTITVESGTHNVTINNVNIAPLADATISSFGILGSSKVILTLRGVNSLQGSDYSPGLQVQNNEGVISTVEINGDGTLNATGGSTAAGIGSMIRSKSGTIVINSGTINANGTNRAAGIGGGSYASGGTITINGGTVNANGADWGAGIGSGYYSLGSTINITGGKITARGGALAAGIGAGHSSAAGNIHISGGEIEARGGANGAGIGNGQSGEGGEILISGGEITATGGAYAAGIGGGDFVDGLLNGYVDPTITISAGTVTALGGEYGSAIGGGYGSPGTEVSISDRAIITAVSSSNIPVINDNDSIITAPEEEVVATILMLDLYKTVELGTETQITDTIKYTPNFSYNTIAFSGLSPDTDYTVKIGGVVQKGTNKSSGIESTVFNLTPGLNIFEEVYRSVPVEANPVKSIADNSLILSEEDGAKRYSEGGSDWILYSGDFTVTGATTTNNIEVYNGTHSIILDNTDIDLSQAEKSPLDIGSRADISLAINGTNTLKAGVDSAGIEVKSNNGNNTNLTITADDSSEASLEVTGGRNGAGIGSSNYNQAGNITINGGIISASGGSNSAGIGGGPQAGSTSIVINDGSIHAVGGSNGAGIGSGSSGEAQIITINGGQVIATGGSASAGIGGGYLGSGGTVTIGNGHVQAFGTDAVGIGAGQQDDEHGTFSTGEDGGAVITNPDIGADATNADYIALRDKDYSLVGSPTLKQTLRILSDETLTVNRGQTLKVLSGIDLINDGTILNYGNIISDIPIVSKPITFFVDVEKTNNNYTVDIFNNEYDSIDLAIYLTSYQTERFIGVDMDEMVFTQKGGDAKTLTLADTGDEIKLFICEKDTYKPIFEATTVTK